MGGAAGKKKSAREKEEAKVVRLYARMHELKAELKELSADAKERAMELYEEHGLTALSGPQGNVAIALTAGSERLDSKLIRALLSKEDLASVTTIGEESLRVSFTPRKGD